MNVLIEKYKGIHPGIILERELKKRLLKKALFARTLKEYPQILNEITKGRRKIIPTLSLKIDKALNLEEGTMLILQAYYDIEREKLKMENENSPNIILLRKALFWDTDMDKINWNKQYKAVIKRVFERGDDIEKNEIKRFYGNKKIEEIIGIDLENNSLKILNHINLK